MAHEGRPRQGGYGEGNAGLAGGWRGGHCRGDSLNNVVTVLARYHMLHAALKLCLPESYRQTGRQAGRQACRQTGRQ